MTRPPIAIVMQAGAPTPVMNRSLAGVARRAREGLGEVYGAVRGHEGVLEEDFIELHVEREEVLEAVSGSPGAALGLASRSATEGDLEEALAVLRALDVRYLYVIGDRAGACLAAAIDAVARDRRYELHVIHVPGSVTNDLAGTDHAPGYGSAARYVMHALIGANLDSRALAGVQIRVVRERDAGFLAASAILARRAEDDGPHLLYVPECFVSPSRVVEDVQEVLDRLGRCVLVVSEGITDHRETPVVSSWEAMAWGSGVGGRDRDVGAFLARILSGELRGGNGEREVSVTVETLPRYCPGFLSPVDAEEARRVGEEAVRLSLRGDFLSGSVGLTRVAGASCYEVEYGILPLEVPARGSRVLPSEVVHETGNDVTEAFYPYVSPLAGPIPEVSILQGHRARRRLAPPSHPRLF